MRLRNYLAVGYAAAAAFFAMLAGAQPARGDNLASVRATARMVAERGLAFVISDAAKWRTEKKCASCHQGTMTVWALSEAKYQGYAVEKDLFADSVKWAKERLTGLDKPRDTRPGWNVVNTPAVYMAIMAEAIPTQEAVSADDLKQITGHIVRHQEDGGNWAWSLSPAQNRPPPVFESDEVVTLLGYLALGQNVQSDNKVASEARESRSKAAGWLAKTTPSDTSQLAALKLLMDFRDQKPAKTLRAEIDRFLKRQQSDGGWSPEPGLQSDAYATGQALYILNLAGVKSDRKEVQRGVAFLIANQKDDGSWPMTPRAQPGATPFKNPSPIVYFGSVWATMGLMRSVK